MSHPMAASSRVEQLTCPTCQQPVLALLCFAGRGRTPRAECPWCGTMLPVSHLTTKQIA